MLRIGITQRVDTVSERRERRDGIDQAWYGFVKKCGGIPIALPNRDFSFSEYVKEIGLHGVILTGGNDLSHFPEAVNTSQDRDHFETDVIRACSELKVPLLGVCRGMQLMAYVYGCALRSVEKHVRTLHTIRTFEDAQFPEMNNREVNSYHRYGLPQDNVGKTLKVLAVSEDGNVEAFRHVEFPQLGIMWHPERPPNSTLDQQMVRSLFQTSTS